MLRPYKPYIPQTPSEIWDLLGWMTGYNPTFVEPEGRPYRSGATLETTFFALKAGFEVCRKKLGEERFQTLMEMADQMRALFEADPEDVTGDAAKGRELLWQMEDVLRPPRKMG